MSNRYKGAVISATPPTTSGGPTGVASGAWTLEQQLQLQAAGLWPSQPVFYIEDVFSTYLYAGNGSTQGITNGINLSANGGLVWIKERGAANHQLFDTVRGVSKTIIANDNGGQQTITPYGVVSFGTDGFTVRDLSNNSYQVNGNNTGQIFASWTFREQSNFFDVVTWTGNATNRTIAHSLGSVPGSIFVKRTDTTAAWAVYHRSLANTQYLVLDTTAAAATGATWWNSTTPTSSVFSVGTDATVNASGGTYIAYIFAHDAGGFGLTGTDNVISCGSFTSDGSGNASVTLGYEPQWVMFKSTAVTGDWYILDNMRGWNMSANDKYLLANTSDAEATYQIGNPTATGFDLNSLSNSTGYIYIAIRRGPMAVPTSGTSVFEPTAFTSQAGNDTVSSGSVSVVDWGFVKLRTSSQIWIAGDRLRGGSYLSFDTTSAEASNVFQWDKQNAFVTNVDDTPSSFIGYSFRRAPSFFDEVCYTGDGYSAQDVKHNLGVVPELIFLKSRSATGSWYAGCNFGNSSYSKLVLQTTAAAVSGSYNSSIDQISQKPTSSNLQVAYLVNTSAETYVSYFFATCLGVSKVGSYTGTGTTLQIDCGFTAGSRFIMIKRTDSTGDWYVWDSARGIIAGNDPYLLLNSVAAEVTGTDYVDTYNAGFEISSTAPAGINASAGSYIFLAIA